MCESLMWNGLKWNRCNKQPPQSASRLVLLPFIDQFISPKAKMHVWVDRTLWQEWYCSVRRWEGNGRWELSGGAARVMGFLMYGLFSFEYITQEFYYCLFPPENKSRKEFLEDTSTFWFPQSLNTHFFQFLALLSYPGKQPTLLFLKHIRMWALSTSSQLHQLWNEWRAQVGAECIQRGGISI